MAEGAKRSGKSAAGAAQRAGISPGSGAVPAPPGGFAVVNALRWVVRLGLYGGLLMPGVVARDLVVFPFIFGKLLFYQALIGLTLPSLLVLWALDPKSRPRRTALLGALLFYFAALGLSTLRSIDPHRSFWSNQERMSGFFQLTHYLVWFLMAASLLRTWQQWRKLLVWQALLGFAMAVIAVLQRPFPSILGELADVRVSGTLGNSIFSGTWHMLQVFLLAFLWLREPKESWLRRFLPVAALTSLAALWLSGSRGPLLGAAAGSFVAAAVYSARTRNWAILGAGASLLALGAGSYALVVKLLVPLPALSTWWKTHPALQHIFLADFDPVRRRLWAKAWESFKDRPLTGFGLSAFDLAFDVHHDPWFRCTGLPNTLQDSSHSLLFDHLSTTGLVGTLGFIALWTTVFASTARAMRAGTLPVVAGSVLVGGFGAYIAQGLFVFDSPGVYVMAYLMMALAGAAGLGWLADAPAAEPAAAPAAPPAWARAWPAALGLLQLAAVALVFQTTVQPFRASYGNKKAQEAWARGSCAKMVVAARAAFALPSPWRDDQLFNVARDLGTLSSAGRLANCPEWRELVDHARQVAGAILKDHPVHARQRSILATLLHLVGREAKDPALLAEAEPLMKLLIAESPLRQQYRFDYANLLAETGRVQEARAQLETALQSEDTIGDSRWRLGAFLWRNLQQARAGAELMSRAQTGSCPYLFRGAVEVQQLAQAYSVLGDKEGLKSVVARLEGLEKDDRPTLVHLGIAGYLERAGMLAERDQVLDLARKRDVTVIGKLAPLADGRVKSLAELERLGAAPSSTAKAQ